MILFDPYDDDIDKLAKYDTFNIRDEILVLWEILDIGYENNIQLDDIDTIFIKGINLKRGIKYAMLQIETNAEQYLSLKYKKNGKQFALKSYGKISKLDKRQIYYILKFTLLVKMLKLLNNVKRLSSEVQFLDKEIPKL